MLDFELINLSYDHAATQLDRKTNTGIPGLYVIENFLPISLLEKLTTFIQVENNWLAETVESGDTPYPKRMKLNWVPDSVIEETHILLEKLTGKLNKEFQRNNKFMGLSIWKDYTGYSISKHTDNPVIDIALQVYLNSNSTLHLGTDFEYKNQKFSVKYDMNTGYIMDNTKKITHSMQTKVPANYVRYSLYAIWTRNLTNGTHS